MSEPEPKMRPPFDPAILDSLLGCDRAEAAIRLELDRIHHGGLAGDMAARVHYLKNVRAEVKETKRRIADRRDEDQKGIYVRHLKAVLVERFGDAAHAMLAEAGDRTRAEQAAIDDARRLKTVGSAVPVIGAASGPKKRKSEVA